MKKFLVFLLSIGCISVFSQSGKIGYVDVKKIFDNYEKAKKVQELFLKDVDAEQKNMDKLQEEIKKLQEDYEKKKDIMKPEERTKKENEIKTKIQEFQKKWTATKQKLDEKGNALEEQLFNEVKSAIAEYAKKNGYVIVINSFDSKLILYGEESCDLTNEIIKLLNKK
ncbi:MAG: OmpH family outer membrane protein [Candidatus Omnitrophica bacterium]|nr:OmpH family outer membrane protein [Candidatus Omnitrophota bacterium]